MGIKNRKPIEFIAAAATAVSVLVLLCGCGAKPAASQTTAEESTAVSTMAAASTETTAQTPLTAESTAPRATATQAAKTTAKAPATQATVTAPNITAKPADPKATTVISSTAAAQKTTLQATTRSAVYNTVPSTVASATEKVTVPVEERIKVETKDKVYFSENKEDSCKITRWYFTESTQNKVLVKLETEVLTRSDVRSAIIHVPFECYDEAGKLVTRTDRDGNTVKSFNGLVTNTAAVGETGYGQLSFPEEAVRIVLL